MIDWLNEELPPAFPETKYAQTDPNGLLAAGGLLTPEWLVKAYRNGIFPWFDDESPILWWSPAPRMVLQPQDLHISRSLRKLMRKPPYTISCNLAFSEIIYQCALPRNNGENNDETGNSEAGTWITQEMMSAYIRLNDNGISHSIECWDNCGNLVGGLYGLLIDRVFFGESMFNRANNASKLAFAYLAEYLFKAGVALIDCQMHSEHMERFGAKEVTREQFEDLLVLGLNSSTKNEGSNDDKEFKTESTITPSITSSITLPVFLT
jgi:leucyl/phenylalanyl-tRNA--protein transferase